MAWKCRKERAHWETRVQSGSKQEERSTYCEIHDCEVVLNSGMTLTDWHNWQQGHIRWQQWFFLLFLVFQQICRKWQFELSSLKKKKKVWLFSCYVCVKKFKVDVLTCWPSFLFLTFPYRPILITALGSLPGLSTLPQMCITDNEWQWVCPQARISQWAVSKKPAGKQMWRANKRIRQLKI